MAEDSAGKGAMRVRARERFSSEITLTPAMVGAYARAAGDDNPVHHDPEFAAATRYRRVIASGTHTTALLLGLTASHFSKSGAMVGLEFWVRFRRPVYADETIRLEWLVVKVTPNEKLQGEIVELRGRIRGADGQTALGAKGRVLVTERL
ncbi:MAG: MaoC family dehydratase [Burkholderiales bacterium]|nr:MaoC family dehydratase [Burkholderiales bacterium]